MSEAPVTQPSLLVRLRDSSDDAAWSRFVEIYAPLVYGFARKHGLQDADAADLTQEVLRAVAGGIRRFEYDPSRGTFRAWFFTVVRNKLRNVFAARDRPDQGSGDTDMQMQLHEVPAAESESAWWDQEYERQVFSWAVEQIRGTFQESTWQAFWLTAVEGKSGKEVAGIVGLSVAAVYLAKGRVMTRLKQQIAEVQES